MNQVLRTPRRLLKAWGGASVFWNFSLEIGGGISRLLPFLFFFFYFFFLLLELHLRRMEVPRVGIQSELQRLGYTTATALQIQATSVTYTTAQSKA